MKSMKIMKELILGLRQWFLFFMGFEQGYGAPGAGEVHEVMASGMENL